MINGINGHEGSILDTWPYLQLSSFSGHSWDFRQDWWIGIRYSVFPTFINSFRLSSSSFSSRQRSWRVVCQPSLASGKKWGKWTAPENHPTKNATFYDSHFIYFLYLFSLSWNLFLQMPTSFTIFLIPSIIYKSVPSNKKTTELTPLAPRGGVPTVGPRDSSDFALATFPVWSIHGMERDGWDDDTQMHRNRYYNWTKINGGLLITVLLKYVQYIH